MPEDDELWIFNPTGGTRDMGESKDTSPPLKVGTGLDMGWAPAISRTPRSSPASAEQTSAWSELDGEPSPSPKSTPTPTPSSPSDGPVSPTSETSFALDRRFDEDQERVPQRNEPDGMAIAG